MIFTAFAIRRSPCKVLFCFLRFAFLLYMGMMPIIPKGDALFGASPFGISVGIYNGYKQIECFSALLPPYFSESLLFRSGPAALSLIVYLLLF